MFLIVMFILGRISASSLRLFQLLNLETKIWCLQDPGRNASLREKWAFRLLEKEGLFFQSFGGILYILHVIKTTCYFLRHGSKTS